MNKVEKLKKILETLNEGVSVKDFKDSFKKVIEIVKVKFDAIHKDIDILSAQLKKDIKQSLSDSKSDIEQSKLKLEKLTAKALKDQADGMNFIRDKVRSIKSGIDGKDGRDGIDGQDGINGKDADEEAIIKKILAQKEKLKIKDIKGLRKILNELKKKKTVYVGGGGGGEIGGHIRYYDLSSQLDGSTRTFTLPAFARVVDVKLSSVPVMRLTTDYTINGSTFQITFTAEISDNQLASGQSCWILYANQ